MANHMNKKTDNEENFKRFQARLEEMKHLNLKPLDHQPTIDELAAEGAKLLEADGMPPVVKNEVKKLSAALGKSSKNPYTRAWAELIAKHPKWRQEEFEKKLDTAAYRDFCKEVKLLGDEYSNQ